MRTLATIFCMALVSGCASSGPSYEAAENSQLIRANHNAVDKLLIAPSIYVDKSTPMLIATLVSIDNLTQSSRFGRLISEQVATRLTQSGFNVIEMKLRNNVYIREDTGELLLSRDVRDLSKSHNAQVVVVGNYAVAAGYTYVTLKMIAVADNRVVSAVNYVLPLNETNRSMLGTGL
jgi:TolB-like protein